MSYAELTELRKILEKGFPKIPGVTVINARELLHDEQESKKLIKAGKDHNKAKCIYLCREDSAEKLLQAVNTVIEISNTGLVYKVQHFSGIDHAILSGSTAFTVRHVKGFSLQNRLKALAMQEPIDEKYIDSIEADADYIYRITTGTTYRCTMYDIGLSRHRQANVGNVLILSGKEQPTFALSPIRKMRKSIYDDRIPDVVIGDLSYYKVIGK